MLSARQFIGAATTALSLITGAFLLALAAGNARAQGSAPACDAAGEIALLPSPWAPWKGAPLRVMLVTEKPLQGELSLTGPDGSVAATSRERHRRPAVFLVHRDQGAGGGLLACDAHAPAGGSRLRPDHARDQGAPGQTGRAGLRGGEHWPELR